MSNPPKRTSKQNVKKSSSGSSSGSGSKLAAATASNATTTTSSTNSNRSIGLRGRPSSVTSLCSHYHNTTGRFTVPDLKTSEALTEARAAQYVLQYGDLLYDSVLVYLYCPVHQKTALTEVKSQDASRGLFVPCCAIRNGESWAQSALNLLHRIVEPDNPSVATAPQFTQFELVDILRVQLPVYYEYITRVSMRMELTAADCKAGLCRDNKVLGWRAETDLAEMVCGVKRLAGPELLLLDWHNTQHKVSTREMAITDVLSFLLNDTKPAPANRELLTLTGYTESIVLLLYGDFLQHCFPSEYMTWLQFVTYCNKLGLKPTTKPTDLPHLFSAFAFNRHSYINFHEFLLGMAMVDFLIGTVPQMPNTQQPTEDDSTHSAISQPTEPVKPKTVERASCPASYQAVRQSRAMFMFYFYTDRPNANTLTEKELTRAMVDFSLSPTESRDVLKLMVGGQLPATEFLKQVTAWLEKGNARGVRCPPLNSTASPANLIQNHQVYPMINLTRVSRPSRKDAVQANLSRARDLCSNCRNKKYTLSRYMVTMSMDGVIYDPVENKLEDVGRMNRVKHSLSGHYFNRSFVCNQLVDMIRKFGMKLKFVPSKIKNDAPDWEHQEQRIRCLEKILYLCTKTKSAFRSGGRVIQVRSPCYIIGDIHGNLHDLLIYEKVIWRLGPYLNAANYLFLGDYVDRGDYSIECIVYLLCMKLLAPERIFMLRGNHECRSLASEFTFLKECIEKFGAGPGAVLFEALNSVFDEMPLVALLDDTIYCAHGGIASGARKVSAISQVSVSAPLKDPEADPVANEVLWNDPITRQEYTDLVHNNQEVAASAKQLPDGFLTNTKRGTGCYFSEKALHTYLRNNSLSHVVRAHEVIPPGYQYHAGGKCVTVFSSSHYCGGVNEAAVAFVQDSKIRVIKVDTHTN